ncbi:MAG: YdcH family protein [Thioalkalispiraceae bacterium]
MPIEKHDLIHELPEYRERIHELKISDTHFAKLFKEYHEVDHEIHRIEEGIETPSDDYTEELKKKRLHMKDELLTMIKA